MDNVKTAIFIGVLVCGLISGHSAPRAQPINASITVEGEDKPWNKGVPRKNREAARNLFLDANRLFYIPLYPQAVKQYIAALATWKHPGFYFNLALTQLNLGQEIEAHESLQRALQYGAEPLGPLPFREAQKQLDNLERQLGRVRITCAITGAVVTMDGTKLFTGPGRYEGWTKAKTHEITAKRSDYVPQTRRLTIAPGTVETLELHLVTQTDADNSTRRWATWKPWAVVATGLTITAASGVLQVLASRNFRSFDRELQAICERMNPPGMNPPECPDPLSHPKEYPDLYGRVTIARQERMAAMSGYIAGGSLLVVGAVLLYANRSRHSERDTSESRPQEVMMIPVISDSTLGILINISH